MILNVLLQEAIFKLDLVLYIKTSKPKLVCSLCLWGIRDSL